MSISDVIAHVLPKYSTSGYRCSRTVSIHMFSDSFLLFQFLANIRKFVLHCVCSVEYCHLPGNCPSNLRIMWLNNRWKNSIETCIHSICLLRLYVVTFQRERWNDVQWDNGESKDIDQRNLTKWLEIWYTDICCFPVGFHLLNLRKVKTEILNNQHW